MNRAPPITFVNWPEARRIVATRHPPIDLFEDIADPRDWELLSAAELKTNPRLAESIGRLDLVPPKRRVGGPGASYVMAPFTHISADWAGRFHDGTFGVYYAAHSFATAVAETAYHRARFYRATGEATGWFAQLRELIGAVQHNLHDLRGQTEFQTCLDPEAYQASQVLARTLRAQGSDGIAYPSVRDPEGECLAAFWPDVIGIPVPGRLLTYHFDGQRIDLVRDETSHAVFQLT